MTLSGYFTYNSVFTVAVLDSGGSNLKHSYVKTNECRPILSTAEKYKPIALVTGNINHFVDIRRRLLMGPLQTCVWSLKSTNLLCSRCRIFVSFRN